MEVIGKAISQANSVMDLQYSHTEDFPVKSEKYICTTSELNAVHGMPAYEHDTDREANKGPLQTLPQPDEAQIKDPSSEAVNLSSKGRNLARLVGVGYPLDYLMKKPRIVIGRNSSKGDVDINMGHSNFISRNHLEIVFKDGQFYLGCGGKNGVFIDDHFQKIGAPKILMPRMCTLRFPSTKIMIRFNAVDDTGDVDGGSYSEIVSPELYTPSNPAQSIASRSIHGLRIQIPNSKATFFSPCPSPTGTISAVNSAPASPTSNGVPIFSLVTKKTNLLFPPTPTIRDDRIPIAGENEEIKPPYSYAQLIVQAISSAPDKQMTLSGIYAYISRNYTYYRANDKGWQNSIRHNLSLNRYFVKVARSQEEPGKGCFWRIDPASEPKLVAQAFRRRNKRGVPYFRGNPSSQSAPASPTRHESHDIVEGDDSGLLSSASTPQTVSVINTSMLPHVISDIRGIQSAPGSPQGYKVLSPASMLAPSKIVGKYGEGATNAMPAPKPGSITLVQQVNPNEHYINSSQGHFVGSVARLQTMPMSTIQSTGSLLTTVVPATTALYSSAVLPAGSESESSVDTISAEINRANALAKAEFVHPQELVKDDPASKRVRLE